MMSMYSHICEYPVRPRTPHSERGTLLRLAQPTEITLIINEKAL